MRSVNKLSAVLYGFVGLAGDRASPMAVINIYILVAPGGSNTLEAKRPNAHSAFLRLACYFTSLPCLSQNGQNGLARAMVARAAACLIGLICEHWAVASSLLRDNASAPPSIGSL